MDLNKYNQEIYYITENWLFTNNEKVFAFGII